MKRVVIPMCEISEVVRSAPVIHHIQENFAQKIKITPLFLGMGTSIKNEIKELIHHDGFLSGKSEHILFSSPETKLDGYHEAMRALGVFLDDFRPDLYISQGASFPNFLMTKEAFIRKIPILNFSSDTSLFEYGQYQQAKKQKHKKMIQAMSSFTCLSNSDQYEQMRKNGFRYDEICITGNPLVDALKKVKHSELDLISGRTDDANGNILFYLDDEFGYLSEYQRARIIYLLNLLVNSDKSSRFSVVLAPGLELLTGLRYTLAAIKKIDVIDNPDYLKMIRLILESDMVISTNKSIECEVISLGKKHYLIDGMIRDDSDHRLSNQEIILPNLAATHHALQTDYSDLPGKSIGVDGRDPISIPIHSNYGDGKAGFRIAKLIDNWARNNVFSPHAYDPWH